MPAVTVVGDGHTDDDPPFEPLIKEPDPEFERLLAQEDGDDAGDDGLAGVPALRR